MSGWARPWVRGEQELPLGYLAERQWRERHAPVGRRWQYLAVAVEWSADELLQIVLTYEEPGSTRLRRLVVHEEFTDSLSLRETVTWLLEGAQALSKVVHEEGHLPT